MSYPAQQTRKLPPSPPRPALAPPAVKRPKVTATADGQTVTAGSRVRPGTGLAAPKVLASATAGQGTGTATVGADLNLSVPSWARGCTYTGVITVTIA